MITRKEKKEIEKEIKWMFRNGFIRPLGTKKERKKGVEKIIELIRNDTERI